MEEKGIEVDFEHSEKHSMFYYKGIPIENHKTFINSETYRIAVKMDKLLQKTATTRIGGIGRKMLHFNPIFHL